ncbi:MAG TPA: DsrE family protein, partial [Actinomycetota bacterium]|nr:DsrE family protein [Actinomycetota bacterium]
MNYLLILNDPAYGTERSYNGFRLARSLTGRDGNQVRVFLMGDGVTCAVAGQKTPNGYYNLERMLRSAADKGAEIACCGSCLDARGLTDDRLADGARRSSLDELT